MVLHTVVPREQDGRDSFGRYRVQVRSAAVASLQILSGKAIDRVYCDLHDDIVVRKKNVNGNTYVFYQVKTRAKLNKNWSLLEVFGIYSTRKKPDDSLIRDSFIGKMLLHTINFDKNCELVVFQTNIHNDDNIDDVLADIESGHFSNKYTKILLEKFKIISDNCSSFKEEEIKSRLSKIRFENDVPFLKADTSLFLPIVREKLYEYSEIDLTHIELDDITIKLLDLISSKSEGVIKPFTQENIDKSASVSIDDLLPLLSISEEAYKEIVRGQDPKAVKSASIIQRTLINAGGNLDDVTYCSKCKTDWDLWYRTNRHSISELDLRAIVSKTRKVLVSAKMNNPHGITLGSLHQPIKELYSELVTEKIIYNLTHDILFGAIFSEIVKDGV
ncbi:dsDNA nuclease domain-containing protein [Citrobacter farmeri]|nr:dsDNA nuclease domain-containing protein [Citrobacter farmeri]